MKRIFFIIILILTLKLGAQVNLVPNPSFENYSVCPNSVGEVDKAFPWYSATGSSPDYFNICNTTAVGVPNHAGGFQYARTGNAYAGLNAYVSTVTNGRDYIQVSLDSTLQAGKEYCVSFYVNLANVSKYAIDGIGAYFSLSAVTCSTVCFLAYSPQISNATNNIIIDTLNWTKVSGNFTASGGEQYMTIGNFKNDGNTDTMTVYSGASNSAAYYLIDDVSVMLCSDTAISVNEINNEEFKISLYPNPSDGNILLKYTIKQNGTFRIYDVTGKLIEEHRLDSNRNELLLTTDLNNGIYLYQVMVNDRIVKSDKLVIIK